MQNRSNTYLLSVRLMVYNHEAYIREAIEGILKQKINFLVEVVIGDDFSTDKSLEIIREYQNTATIHFKILERKEGDTYWQNRQKLGRLHNFYNIVENCTGKYIALLDGDDYWTDPLKLQKQVDFLEKNEDFSICFHNMHILNESNSNSVELTNDKNQASVSNIFDLATKGNFIFTASAVFRKPVEELPNWLDQLSIGDYPLHLYNAQFGNIKYLDEVMGVYRVHEGGIWGVFSKEKLYERWIPMLSILENKFSEEVNEKIQIQKKNTLLDIYTLAFKKNEVNKAKETMSLLMETDSFFIAKKLTEIQSRLEKTLHSNAYNIGKTLIKIVTGPIQFFKK